VSQLKILNFANNSIKVIPDDFRALKDLEKFDFKGNQIEEIPDFIAEFSFVKATGLNIDSAFRDNHISKLSP
jgi:Leucine-rich repeat (LRR) protein